MKKQGRVRRDSCTGVEMEEKEAEQMDRGCKICGMFLHLWVEELEKKVPELVYPSMK